MSETKTAADVLRERAERADGYAGESSRYKDEEYFVYQYRKEAAELRALADLVEASLCKCCDPPVCLICFEKGEHHAECKLAAVERVFAKEGR